MNVGDKYNRLTIVAEAPSVPGKRKSWICQCECGNSCIATTSYLRLGRTKSCGCYNRDKSTKHGLSRSRIYSIWCGMISRCYNENNTRYADYGGRGIKVCKRWHSFRFFYKDMKDSYAENLSIDRVNVKGNYNKTNCRWATIIEQANNTRRNRFLTIDDKKQTVAQWAAEVGVAPGLISTRLSRGYSEKDAIYGKSLQ